MADTLPRLLGRATETLPSVLAERAAHEIRAMGKIEGARYAITLDYTGRVWMEIPAKALLSETVGVYSADTLARELARLIGEDLRFMLAETRSHGLRKGSA